MESTVQPTAPCTRCRLDLSPSSPPLPLFRLLQKVDHLLSPAVVPPENRFYCIMRIIRFRPAKLPRFWTYCERTWMNTF